MERTIQLFLFSISLIIFSACANKNTNRGMNLSDADVQKIGEQAYVYGYPLVLMGVTEDIMTQAPQPTTSAAPVNQFSHKTEFPDDTFTDVVSPNVDTLYSTAWLDLSKEPVILSVPAMGQRYYMLPMLDAWTNVFASPGTRTTGNEKKNFAITGPGWNGKLPKGVTEIKAPTNDVWILGRTQTNGKKDYAAVGALQKQYKLTPLSAWGSNYVAPTNMPLKAGVLTTKAAVDQVAEMSGEQFFKYLSRQMSKNPPPVADQEMVVQLRRIAIGPGQNFDPARLSKSQLEALDRATQNGQAIIKTAGSSIPLEKSNGWTFFTKDMGNYGTNYKIRAFVAWSGLGANLPDDVVYMRTAMDSSGDLLMGGNKYTITFTKDQLPPVRGFWSITVYDPRQFLVKNSINRYALGSKDKMKYGKDGSLTIYVQHDEPDATKIANWLPSPDESFSMLLRTYWPRQAILAGKWQAPEVRRTIGGPNNLSLQDQWFTGDEE